MIALNLVTLVCHDDSPLEVGFDSHCGWVSTHSYFFSLVLSQKRRRKLGSGLEHTELELSSFAHHVFGPLRFPDQFDMRFFDAGD